MWAVAGVVISDKMNSFAVFRGTVHFAYNLSGSLGEYKTDFVLSPQKQPDSLQF